MIKKLEDIFNKYSKALTITLILITPLVYLHSKDEFLAMLIIAVSILIYILGSSYIIKKIEFAQVAIELEEKIDEVNITVEKFNESIGKILEIEYYELSNSAYAITASKKSKALLPILDELRVLSNNTNNKDITINRNESIYSSAVSNLREIEKILSEYNTNDEYEDLLLLIKEINRTNIEKISLEDIIAKLDIADDISEVKKLNKKLKENINKLEKL